MSDDPLQDILDARSPADLALAQVATLLGVDRVRPGVAELGFTLATPDPEPPARTAADVEADVGSVLAALEKEQSALARAINLDLRAAVKLADSLPGMLAGVREVIDRYRPALVRMLAGARAAAGLLAMARLGEAVPQAAPVAASEVNVAAGPVGPKALPLVRKAAAQLQSRRLLLPPEVQGKIDQAAQDAESEAARQAEATQQALRDGLAETLVDGGTLEDFRGTIQTVLQEKSFLAEKHVENVFRTNVMEAYSRGQMDLVRGDAQVASLYPYAAYHATHDDRTREQHLALETLGLDGTNVYRVDDPVFQQFRPPWDFNCRCTWSPLTVRQAAAKGVKEAQAWLESGRPPGSPQYVPAPVFGPPADYRRELSLADEIADLLGFELASPPPGYKPAPRSKKGAFRKRVGDRWAYWYDPEAGATPQPVDTPSETDSTPAPAPESREGLPAAPKRGAVYNAPVGELSVDPERFQFKLNTDASGVTDELKRVRVFNPDFAGVISVWRDPADGRTYVVNGHHRHELARRLGHPELAVRFIEAADARQARAVGALINIAEGRGTAIDAAKFLRDSGLSVDDLAGTGVSLRGRVAADAAVLSRLNDRLFDRLARGLLDEGQCLAIARHLEDPALQDQLMSLLENREADGRETPTRVVEEMAREVAATPTATRTEKSLFGDIESSESLFVQRNELKAFIRSELAREANDFSAVASERRAERVAGAGNTLNVTRNREVAAEAGRAKNVFDQLVNRKGEISDRLNQAALAYAGAKTKKERENARRRAYESVRAAVLAEAGLAPERGGEAGGPGAGQTPAPGAGPAPGAEDGGGGDSRPAGLSGKVDAALARYDERGGLRGEAGALFGGDDLRSRELFHKLPDGTEVVVTDGANRGRTGKLVREKSLDGSERIALLIDGEETTVPVAHDAVEPLDDRLSWRTAMGSAPRRQEGLFGRPPREMALLDEITTLLGFDLGWQDDGPSPQGGKKRRWVGTPPDKGVRHQISKPGSRSAGKKGGQAKPQPAKKATRPRGTSGMKQAASGARKMARELRAQGDDARADHLDRLASEWDAGGQPPEDSTASVKQLNQQEQKSTEQEKKPRHRVKDDTPRGASVRMNAFLDARVDRAALRKYAGKGADLFDGAGTHGPQKQAVFPIEGKFYVVDFGKEGSKFTQTLREVPESEVKFHRR